MTNSNKKIILGSVSGNVFEAYDLTITAVMAKQLSSHFLGPMSDVRGVFFTFLILSLAYISRPIGALFFGYIADVFGRKKTLIYSLSIMSASTFLIAMAPGYSLIGWWSFTIFFILKLFQGLAAGGEYMGSIVFLIENSRKNQNGFMGSWGAVGMNTGILLATSSLVVLSNFNLDIETWRAALLLSIIGGFIGLWIRVNLPESLPFIRENSEEKDRSLPLLAKEAFKFWRNNLNYSIPIAGLSCLGFCSTYLIFIYGPVHMSVLNGLPILQSFTISALSLASVVIQIPIFGYISDKIGKENLLVFASGLFFILSYPYFWSIKNESANLILTFQLALSTPAAMLYATIPVRMVSTIPTRIRCTLGAIQYNLYSCLFGGTAPLIAMALTKATNNMSAPAFYLMICSLISALSAIKLRSSSKYLTEGL